MKLNLSILPKWSEVDKVFNAVNQHLSSLLLDSEQLDKYTMIACELVENAIKYGDFSTHQTIDISIFIDVKNKDIEVQVVNPVGVASKPYLKELDSSLQWVRSFQDSYEAYVERIKEISMEPMEYQKSGLGLVRIVHEGQATIDFFTNEDKLLKVSAISQYK